jgi:hypothetical protein
MQKEATVAPGKAIVAGQSGAGWGAIALSSLNPSAVKAIITFAAGRGGGVLANDHLSAGLLPLSL